MTIDSRVKSTSGLPARLASWGSRSRSGPTFAVAPAGLDLVAVGLLAVALAPLYPTLMALVYIDAIVVLLSILLSDVLYSIVDPRISPSADEESW